MKLDGHIHTPYCPHGSTDIFEEYIDKALEHQFTEISFTEHAPLPRSFKDPTPKQDSAMKWDDVDKYIEELQLLKEKFCNKIKINIGFEVDFIEGYEGEIKHFLNSYGPQIDDSILSVHFLKHKDEYFCLDFSPEEFEKMIHIYGSTDMIYENYYKTVLKSIQSDLGLYKPKRLGHITLVHKFQKRFKSNRSFKNEIFKILDLVHNYEYQLDYNGAGVVKPLCEEPYPPEWVAHEAIIKGIPLIYGSDAHSAKGINQGFSSLHPAFREMQD